MPFFFYPICYDVPSHDQSSAASLPKDPKDLAILKLVPIIAATGTATGAAGGAIAGAVKGTEVLVDHVKQAGITHE